MYMYCLVCVGLHILKQTINFFLGLYFGKKTKGEIIPHGVACENSHLSLLHAARDISPGYMV